MSEQEKPNKYLSLVKNEIGGQLDDLRINGAEKAAAASSATYSWAIIGVVGFFTYMSFVLLAPFLLAHFYVKFVSTEGNAILIGYTCVFLFHLILLLLLITFRKRLLQKKMYNKVFETIFYMGENTK